MTEEEVVMTKSMRKQRRRGGAIVQWCVVAGLIILTCVVAISIVGDATNEGLQETAVGVGDPGELTKHFSTSE